jgi:hypothetical protein
MALVRNSRLYYFDEQAMHFKVTFTLHVARVVKWIHYVKEAFLNGVHVIVDNESPTRTANMSPWSPRPLSFTLAPPDAYT